jgi:hypothetical protein
MAFLTPLTGSLRSSLRFLIIDVLGTNAVTFGGVDTSLEYCCVSGFLVGTGGAFN